MDDFGKDYSSLSLLTENRFDTIKVDKFFFENSLATDKEKNIAKNIINLLSSVGCKICLEGIETLTCLDYLATVNRQVLLQGYYFSKPIPEVKFEQFLDTIFPFNYPVDSDKIKPQVIVQTVEVEKKGVDATDTDTNNHTTINVTTNTQNEALDSLKAQMSEMQRKFEQQLQEQRELTHKRDIELMQQQLEFIKKTQEMQAKNKPVELETQLIDNREDDRVKRLKEQLDELERERERDRRERERERDRERDSYRDRRDYDDLQQQIRDLKNQQNNNGPMGYPYPYPPYAPYPYPYPYPQQQQPQQNIDVDALIEKLSKKQKEQVDSAMDEMKAQNQSLQDRLDAERKEREELEAMLRDIQTKGEEEEADEAEQEREQEEADKALTLDVDALPVDDDNDTDEDADNDADDDTNSENEEPVEKSELTLEQIEALVKNYQDRFQEDWMSHAKEELQGGFDELVKGLRFYKLQNAERKTFVDKVKKLSPEVKQIYNIVKNEFMKYNGVTNKLTNSCDVLYKGRNQIAKINFTKSRVRLYLGLDPNNAEYAKIPHKDLSNKRAHARTPFYMLLKSPLSVKRAKKLIADLMVIHNCEENLNYKPIDYATKYKFFKKDQKSNLKYGCENCF